MIAIFSLTMATSLIIGGFIFINSIDYIENETNDKLIYMSRTHSLSLSERLNSVETIIETIHSQIVNSFNIEMLKNSSSYLEEYEESLDGFFRETALSNDDFESIYITFDRGLTNEFREIWYLSIKKGDIPQRVDNELYNQYTDNPTTENDGYPNISLFNPENPAMEYYYSALEADTGAWYEPAQEVGFPLKVIVYTRPVYKDRLLIGVIGIDINVESIRESIKDLEVMKNGYAFLLNDDLEVIVHPNYPEYTSMEEAEPESYSLLTGFTDKNKPAKRIFKSDTHIFSCGRLSNGWILVLALELAEIFKPLEDLAYSIIIIALLITGFSFLAARAFSNRISGPVEAAAEQLRHLEIGDYSLKIPLSLLKREDEIGTFVKSVDTISELISQEVEKNRQKDVILTYQSRLAKTGEMIAHIAHQWRQPLNNLNLILSNIREDYHEEIAGNLEIEQSLNKCGRIIKDMSQTIDDFRYFLNPRDNKEYFSIRSTISFVIDLMEDSLQSHNIRIHTQFTQIPQLFGSANEFTQVISNTLYNARDALLMKTMNNREISISLSQTEDEAIVEIFNNGPEIPETVMEKLFKPYFTTKGEEKGTGIGLYMSRFIIEKHFHGNIVLLNRGSGVLCRVTVPVIMNQEDMNE